MPGGRWDEKRGRTRTTEAEEGEHSWGRVRAPGEGKGRGRRLEKEVGKDHKDLGDGIDRSQKRP